MTKEEKLEIVINAFFQLPEDKQAYILGTLQALVFAHNQNSKDEQPEFALCGSGKDTKLT